MFSEQTHKRLVHLDTRDNDLEFDEITHTYYLNGKALKNVTTILQDKGLAPSYKSVSKEKLESSARYGTYVHKEIEEWIKFGKEGNSTELREFITWLDTSGYIVVGSECMVHNDTVAGTIDLVLFNKQTLDLCIADIKTTSVIHIDSCEWQVSCYAYLDKYVREQYGEYNNAKVLHFKKDGNLEVRNIHFKERDNVYNLMELELLPSITLDKHQKEIIKIASAKLKQAEDEVAFYKAQLDEVKERICIAMEENGVKQFKNEHIIITYVAPKESKRVDTDKLKKDFSDVYEKCIKTTTSKASVRITYRTNEDEE